MHPSPLKPGWTPLHSRMQRQRGGCWFMGCRESTGKAQNCLASLPRVHDSLPHQWEDE